MKRKVLYVLGLSLLLGGCTVNCKPCVPVETYPTKTSEDVFASDSINEGLQFKHLENESALDYFYNYCATGFEEDGVRHIYYCANKDHSNITDYIAHRSATKDTNGKWVYGDIEYVLAPTADTWDSRHTCDPTIVKGKFKYNNVEYKYMLGYLGCVTSDNSDNEFGIAVSNSPSGPFVKIGNKALISYTHVAEYGNANWGYGQGSLVSVDNEGQVLIFYTVGSGSTYEMVERWDLSNLNNPVKLNSRRVTTRGIKNLNGGSDIINNADYSYDAKLGRFYMIKDDHPTPVGNPSVAQSVTLYYLEENTQAEGYYPGYTLFNGTGDSWVEVGQITESNSGFNRNHNAGLIKDPYGHTLLSSSIPVVYTAAKEVGSNNIWACLSTYRVYQHTFEIKE